MNTLLFSKHDPNPPWQKKPHQTTATMTVLQLATCILFCHSIMSQVILSTNVILGLFLPVFLFPQLESTLPLLFINGPPPSLSKFPISNPIFPSISTCPHLILIYDLKKKKLCNKKLLFWHKFFVPTKVNLGIYWNKHDWCDHIISLNSR